MTLASGTNLGPYEIIAPLGKGGMGEVYRAKDSRLGRTVAIKVLLSKLTDDAERRERFIREARAASALNHPNIVTIHEIGEAEANRFIVMELVEGRTLRAVATQGIPLESVVQLIGQVARALAVAHAAGIVHRDIKPENIMVREDGYVKVLDFGLARLITVDTSQSLETTLCTGPGSLLGTMRYMSPEQARGEPVDSAADIFALGIVLYELATGRHPFIGRSPIDVLHAIISIFPPRPSQLNPEVNPTLEGLILKMLEKDPRLRPSAAEADMVLAGLVGRRGGLLTAPPPLRAKHNTVGREKELGELRAAFESVVAGHGLVPCVPGEPGVGKTTLVEEFLTEVTGSSPPCNVARGRCSERLAGTEAYLPILEALENLLHTETRDSVARVMRLIAPNWCAQIISSSIETTLLGSPRADIKVASQERLKRELTAFLQEVCGVRPLILFFDDLHWADVSTVDMLAYISARISSMRLLVVVSYRPSDLLLGNHPFLPTKLDLQARGICHEIPLGFLSRNDIEQYLLLEFPGHRFPPEFPALIHAKTEGSPLFMVDLLRYLRHRRIIDEVQGRWALAQSVPEVERDLPESVRSMIQKKIAQLHDDDRKLLAAASVQGHEFDSAVVSKTLAADAVEVEERLEILERVHAFVRRVREREFPDRTLTLQYRFVHVLYQNVLYASLTPARRGSLSAAVARALLDYDGEQNPTIVSELALLFEAARDFSSASHYFLLAAQNAVRVFANQEAIVLARRGLDMLKLLPASAENTAREILLQILLGKSLIWVRGMGAQDVEKPYLRAIELCQQSGDTSQLFLALSAIWYCYFARAELHKALQHAQRLLSLAESAQDPALLIDGHRAFGITQLLLGETNDARLHVEQAIVLCNPLRLASHFSISVFDPNVECLSHSAQLRWLLGYPDHALRRVYEALSLAQRSDNPRSVCLALIFVVFVHALRREMERTLEAAEQLIPLASEHDLPEALFWGTLFHGWVLADRGRWEEGLAEMRQGVGEMIAMDPVVSPMSIPFFAEALIKAAQTEEALKVLSDELSFADRTGAQQYSPEVHRLRGDLMQAQNGLQADAEACFRQSIDIARRQCAKSLELRAVKSLSRLWQHQGRKEEARQMLAEIYGWFTEGSDTADLKEARALLEELS